MTWLKRLALVVVLSAHAAGQSHPKEDFDPSLELGFDPSEFSNTVRPQDDFFRYVNGPWIDNQEIPDDRLAIGTWLIQYDRTQDQIRAIIERSGNDTGGDADSTTIRNLYTSFTDTKSIEQRGLSPIKDLIERIDHVDSHHELPSIFGSLAQLGVEGLFRTLIFNDAGDPSRLLLYFLHSGIGLPSREYYLSEQAEQVFLRNAYQNHIRTMFELVHWPEGDLAAENVLKLETRLAEVHWTAVQNRDWQTLSANKFSLDEAEEQIESFLLRDWLKHAGAPVVDHVVLAQPSYFQALTHIVLETPIKTWKFYLKIKVLKTFAPFLIDVVRTENFRFDRQILRGQLTQKPRHQEGVEFVSDLVSDLIDRHYVEVHYSQDLATYTHEMIEHVRAAFYRIIENTAWMGESTKKEALEKLTRMEASVGQADWRRDYSTVATDPQELIRNVMNIWRFHHDTSMNTLDRQVGQVPSRVKSQNVNGVYNPVDNTFTLGVALLQAPMFVGDHPHNYGSLGASIGHEISHGFDDQGRKFTSDGKVSNWWTKEEVESFKASTDLLVAQYDKFKPLRDLSVNGELTLGENVADLVGLRMAYRAFKRSKYANAGSAMGFTPDQRFFVGYALFHRLKMSEPFLREFVIRGPHAPAQSRVNGVLRNMPEFYEAFGVQADDGMYLEQNRRVQIW